MPAPNPIASAEDWQLAILLSEVGVFVASYTAAFVLVPLAAAASAAPVATVGLVTALPGLVGVVLGIPSAAASNCLGRRPLIQGGFVILTLAVVGYLVAPSFLWLIPSQIAMGMAMIIFWPSALAAFAEIPGRHSHELRQGANTLLQGIGSLIGAAVAGGMVSLVGFPFAFVMLVPLALIGLGIGPALRETTQAATRASRIDVRGSLRIAIGRGRRAGGGAVAALAMLPWSMLWWVAGATFFVLYVSQAGYSAAFIGFLIAVRIGVASVVRLAFAPIARRIPMTKLLLAGNALGGLALAAAALSTNETWLVGSVIVQGAGLSVVLPASNVMIMRGTGGSDRVVGLAMSASLTNCAILVGPMLLAAVSSAAGGGAALAFAGLLAAAASVGLARLL